MDMMEESRGLKGAKILQSIASQTVEEETTFVKERIQTRIKTLKDLDSSNINNVVEVEFSLAKNRIQTRIMEIDKDRNHASAFEQLKLQFTKKISPSILTGEEIKGEEGASMEVALIDVATGKVMEVEPEASSSVEIVLSQGEPDASDEFKETIPLDMSGKKSLLVGDTRVQLQRGIGVMKTIKLKHRAKEMNPPVFHLWARAAVDTIGREWIKSAKTGPFTVKNYRRKYYDKRATPCLKDEIYRLANIRKGGPFAKRLQDNEIETVEDLLISHLKDPQGLKTIVNMGAKKWGDTLANARACADKRMYCYADVQQKTAIVFNVLGEVLLMHSNNQYLPTNNEAEAQKILLASAYRNWKKDVMHFDDKDSLQEHLAGLRKLWDPPDSQIPDYYPSCSYLNHPEDISVDDYDLTLDDDFTLGTRCSSFNPEAMAWDFNSQCQRHSSDRQSNGGKHIDAGFDESQDVENRQPPNGWKLFFRVWRWSSVIKKRRSANCVIVA